MRILVATIAYLFCAAALATSDSRTNIFYGDDPSRLDRELQTLDIYWNQEVKKKPVIIYVHGGGWAFGDKSEVNHKPDYFTSQGFAFVSMNYRLRWDHKLFDQLQDIVSVVDWVHKNAETYGIDANRIVLMGHEAGGHLVSLVGTDVRHLKSANYSLENISAVVSIDSVSYDIPRVHRELGSFVERRQHRLVFGEDEAVQRESSPAHHVRNMAVDTEAGESMVVSTASQTLPSFALLYLSDQDGSRLQAEGFAKALTGASASIIVIPSSSGTKGDINVELGAKGHGPTGALMAFLRVSS